MNTVIQIEALKANASTICSKIHSLAKSSHKGCRAARAAIDKSSKSWFSASNAVLFRASRDPQTPWIVVDGRLYGWIGNNYTLLSDNPQ